MCGRASLTKPQKELEQRLQAEFYREDLEQLESIRKYNIAPTHMHPVITDATPEHFQFFRWGLIPSWAKDEKIGSRMINARSETVFEKPAFRAAIRRRRCLVPFDGFYEWKKTPAGKVPYRITLTDGGVFCVAGIWEHWVSPEGQEINSFAALTQEPNELMAPIHNRMPFILLRDQERQWIEETFSDPADLKNFAPYPVQELRAYIVSSRVNKVACNDSSLVEEVAQDPSQGSLF